MNARIAPNAYVTALRNVSFAYVPLMWADETGTAPPDMVWWCCCCCYIVVVSYGNTPQIADFNAQVGVMVTAARAVRTAGLAGGALALCLAAAVALVVWRRAVRPAGEDIVDGDGVISERTPLLQRG